MTSQDDETRLFRSNVPGVVRLDQDRVKPYRQRKKPLPRQRLEDERRTMAELLDTPPDSASFGSGDELTYLRDGYPPRLLKRLRKGYYSVQEELDLHGYVVTDAKRALRAFIRECRSEGIGCVRIIHGKGLRSPGRTPVIKNYVLGWLSQFDNVVAVCSAPQHDGGTGAVYVLLR